MIQRILEIDNKARDMMARAEKLKAQQELGLEEKKEALRTGYLQRANDRIAKVETEERAHAETAFAEKAAKYQRLLDDLSAAYQAHGNEWISAMAERVLHS